MPTIPFSDAVEVNARWQWMRENTDGLSHSILEIQIERGELIQARWDDHYDFDPAQPKFTPDKDSVPVCAEIEQLLGIEPIYREDLRDVTTLRMKRIRRYLRYTDIQKKLFGYIPDYEDTCDKIAHRMQEFNDYWAGRDRSRKVVSILVGRYNGIMTRDEQIEYVRHYPFINADVFDEDNYLRTRYEQEQMDKDDRIRELERQLSEEQEKLTAKTQTIILMDNIICKAGSISNDMVKALDSENRESFAKAFSKLREFSKMANRYRKAKSE